MIDEKKLIEELDVRYERYCDRYVADGCSNSILLSYLTEVYMIREIVRNQRLIDCSDCSRRKWDQLGFNDAKRWIPCSERLPEKSGYYLYFAADAYGGLQDGVGVSYYQHKVKKWKKVYTPRVTHWQPLPEPYRGE